ncbi:PepSY-associated TM helix domain-containing protein [Gloeobacter morelensis]|uniref:PepSY domain-containing protein n=1 Tax=Gloeobacter morelensis MG652769 TaxID=2781736 RepID=A0ABY3PJP2_9CYAN|nr:PepSY-associated TM helix domain-containing protein [Gloeobacter morelensis]UFP93848.1 PepSY domain-containing protein [Gloeobacter morelensis MG652769]
MFTLHQFAGLFFGLILLVIGLTGSAIVFWQPLDRQLNPELYRPAQRVAASMDRVVDAARAHYPHSAPTGVFLREGNVHVVNFTTPGDKRLQVFVDPETYRVRGSRYWEESLVGVLYKLHYTLLAGEAGEWITGISAVMLLALGITGVVLWPGWKKWQAGTSLRWRSHSRIVAYDLHKLSGILTSVFLAILGLTGAYFMFYEPFRAAVYAVTFTPEPPKPISTPVTGRSPLGADAAIATARPLLAGAELYGVSLPTKPEGTVNVLGRFALEGPASRYIRVFLDQYSGQVRQVKDARKPNTPEFILNWMAPLHFGTYGGLFTQVMYLFVGLAPGGLFLTGFWLWLKKLRRSRVAAESEQKLPV